MNFQTQTFLVFGLCRSGLAASLLLLGNGAKVYAFDEGSSATVEENAKTISSAGGEVLSPERVSVVREECQVLVLSPGIAIDHPLAVWFKQHKKRIIGELELGWLVTSSQVVAVTGTNGKTTCTRLIEHLLNHCKKRAVACGNIGTPLCAVAETLTKDDVAVVEVSSFQLETTNAFCPHICVELNFAEDHLNRHYTLENYAYLKKKLLSCGRESEIAVLNWDDKMVRTFAKDTKMQVEYFSLTQGECNVQNGDIMLYDEKVISVADLPLSGAHNVYNVLAACLVCHHLGVPTHSIGEALLSFHGERHRLERVGEIEGVRYINDSKATNPSATEQALATLSESGEILLLLGGQDKGFDYSPLFSCEGMEKVVHIFLYGENTPLLLPHCTAKNIPTTVVNSLQSAVTLAKKIATHGQTVLLSPASASFDMFSGYEQRGDEFCRMALGNSVEN